jgi:hypothetical protein
VRDHNGQALAYVYFKDEPGPLLSQPSAGVDCEPRISAVPGYVEVIHHLVSLTVPNFECP